jgi:hypothetical protein
MTRVPGNFYDNIRRVRGKLLARDGTLHGLKRLNGDIVRPPISTASACHGSLELIYEAIDPFM